jgi:hypothetical protein
MATVKCITALRQSGFDVKVGTLLDAAAYEAVTYPTFFSSDLETTTLTATIAVTVPAITDPDIAKVDVDISGDAAAAAALGCVVLAVPQEAMETNCRILNSYLIAADSVRVVFGSEGGNVTGGAKNFKFYIVYN